MVERDTVTPQKRVFSPPLIKKSQSANITRRGGNGAEVAVHHRAGVIVIFLRCCYGIEVFAYPDVPGPKNIPPRVPSGDDGVSVLQGIRRREIDRVISITNIFDETASRKNS